MVGLNKVQLIGHLGRDPETRRTQSGDAVVSFSIATSESWKDKASGERKEKTEWHNVVVWNEGIGKVAEQYLRKGSKVYVEGQLQTREHTDKDGNKKKSTEIILQRFRGELVLLDSKGDRDGDASSSRPADRGSDDRGGSSKSSGGRRAPAPMDDDIPF